MPQRIIPSREYTAGQVIDRTFDDLDRFGRVGIEVNVETWPVGVTCLELTIALSNGQTLNTTFAGGPLKNGSFYKGIELAQADPDAFDRVTVTAHFLETVVTDFRLWGERTLNATGLRNKL